MVKWIEGCLVGVDFQHYLLVATVVFGEVKCLVGFPDHIIQVLFHIFAGVFHLGYADAQACGNEVFFVVFLTKSLCHH